MRELSVLTTVVLGLAWSGGSAVGGDFSGLSKLVPGRVAADNALWIETPKDRQFKNSKEVVVADLRGPGVITMIHFAMPHMSIADHENYTLGRELVLRAYWDGETEPSVDVPMVDFFCDPAGLREQVNTALVNKRRGFNAYFPMPFRKSARLLLIYQGDEPPGDRLWAMMPCYSYVMWRSASQIPADEGYFHAQWRQAAVLMGKEPYLAMEATGRGKFVGWNVTVRRPGTQGYPVDMNERFYIDGERQPSVEFQGIEDSFGFSWGFPPTENVFPLTGFWPFKLGAFAYRFFVNDAINFEKSLKVEIAFGENEDPFFHDQFSRPGTKLQLSSTCYWYQTEPHVPFPPLPSVADRAPAPEKLFWPDPEPMPDLAALKARNVKLHMLCGRPEKQIILADPGFDVRVIQGSTWSGWPPPVFHCLSDNSEIKLELILPEAGRGTLRLFLLDADNMGGGRRQQVFVGDKDLGMIESFQGGRWLETPVSAEQTAEGRLLIRVVNHRDKANAVISMVEWVAAQ